MGSFIFQAEHGEVIELLGGAYEGGDGITDGRENGFRGAGFGGPERLDHAVSAVHLLFGVRGFRDTVGVDEEAGTGLQVQGVFPVADALHAAQDEAVFVLQKLKGAVCGADGRIFVAGAGSGQKAR